MPTRQTPALISPRLSRPRLANPPEPPWGNDLKGFLDQLVIQHKTPQFVAADPISLPARYVADPQTCEMVAFLTAMLSYGQRAKIIETVNGVLEKMDHDPAGFIQAFRPSHKRQLFKSFVYRFNRGDDLLFLFERLQWTYAEFGSLENLFIQSNQAEQSPILQNQLIAFVDAFTGPKMPVTNGLRFMLAHPKRGGACKRLHMFLRWVVRHDPEPSGQVDLGLWRKALTPADLLIPVDTHVSKISRLLGLTQRKTDDWQTAEDITAILREFHPTDPIQYDFALMGYGLSLAKKRSEP